MNSSKSEYVPVNESYMKYRKRGINWKFWQSRRHIVTLMGLWGFFNFYAIRGSLSVAIVAMTQFRNVTLENGTFIQEQTFQWDSTQRNMALGSLYYGSIFTGIISGILAARFGGNIVFGWGLGISAILFVISTVAAKLGLYVFCTVGLLIGMCFGCIIPSIQDIYSHWAPLYERTRMTGLIQSGSEIGTLTSFFLSGVIIEYLGWESVFYIFGSFGFLWFILWIIYIKRDPASDPRISIEEKTYIESSIIKGNCCKTADIPWISIFTSMAVWAQIISAACDAFACFLFLLQIPTYLRDVLNFNLDLTGYLSAAPYLMSLLLVPVVTFLSDYLRSRKILSTKNTRKLTITIGFTGTSTLLVIMANSTNTTTVWICLIGAVGMTAFTRNSYFPNTLDIASTLAPIVMGFGSMFALSVAGGSSTVIGIIVRNGTRSEWKIIFYITCVLNTFGNIFFLIFGQGETQEWAKSKPISCTEPLQSVKQDEEV